MRSAGPGVSKGGDVAVGHATRPGCDEAAQRMGTVRPNDGGARTIVICVSHGAEMHAGRQIDGPNRGRQRRAARSDASPLHAGLDDAMTDLPVGL